MAAAAEGAGAGATVDGAPAWLEGAPSMDRWDERGEGGLLGEPIPPGRRRVRAGEMA